MVSYVVSEDGALNDKARALLDRKNYAVLATYGPDGSVHQSVLWVMREGNDLLFSTVEGRTKHKNILRDLRAHVIVYDRGDPEEYVEVAGEVEVRPDPEKKFSNLI